MTCKLIVLWILIRQAKILLRLYVNDVVLVFLLLTLNIFHTFSSVSIVDFEQVDVSWKMWQLHTKVLHLSEALNASSNSRISGHISDGHFPDGLFPNGHFPDRHFSDQTHHRCTFSWSDTSPTNTSPTDTSPTDTSRTRHIPDRHFPDQTNARQMFSWVDASHNGHFSDQLNTSNNLKYLKKYIVRDNFGNIHAVVRTLEI